MILASLLVVGAGCVEPPVDGRACVGSLCGLPPLLPGGTVPDWDYPMVQFVGCADRMLAYFLPTAALERSMPPAFTPRTVTGHDAELMFHFMTCERTVNDTAVFGSAHVVLVSVFAQPRNLSWMGEGHFQYYLLDVATDRADLASALKSLSVPATLATIEVTPAAGRIEQWTIQSPAWSGVVRTTFATNGTGGSGAFTDDLWYGTDVFHRAADRRNQTYRGLLEGSVHAVGDAAFIDALAGNAATPLGAFYTDVDEAWRVDARFD